MRAADEPGWRPWALAAAFLALYAPGVVRPSLFCDEGIWAYIGWIWDAFGLAPYQAAIENKPPLIFLAYRAAHALFGHGLGALVAVRALALVLVVLSSVQLAAMGRRMGGPTAAWLAQLVYLLMMGWSATGDLAYVYTESFMIPFAVLGFGCVQALDTATPRTRQVLSLAAGVAFCLAVNSKQIAITTLAGAGLYLLLRPGSVATRLKPVLGLGAGFAAAQALVLLPLLLAGVSVPEFVEGTWTILLNAGSAAQPGQRLVRFLSTWGEGRLSLLVWLLAGAAAVGAWRGRLRDPALVLIACWFLFDFVGANAAGRLSKHQVKQVVPALALGCGYVLSLLQQRWPLSPRLLAVLVTLALFPYLAIYKSFASLVLAPARGAEVVSHEDLPVAVNWYRHVGEWLAANSDPADRVFVQSGSHESLYYSRRRVPGRHLNQFFLHDQAAVDEFMREFAAAPPRYYVVEENGFNRPPEVDEELAQRYRLRTTLAEGLFRVYERVER